MTMELTEELKELVNKYNEAAMQQKNIEEEIEVTRIGSARMLELSQMWGRQDFMLKSMLTNIGRVTVRQVTYEMNKQG